MAYKNKNHTNNISDSISTAATHLGVAAMLMATVAATAETAIHEGQKMAAILQPQAVYASATEHIELQPGHELRRAGGTKEEIHHSSASYGSMKRSPSVSGSL